jgi:putative Mn2+ efflux pump MntP
MTLSSAIVVLALSIGANLDNLGVGSAYALAGKEITFPANVAIGAVSAILALLAAWLSALIGDYVSQSTARYLSAGIFIVLGLWAFWDGARTINRPRPSPRPNAKALRPRIVPVGEVGVLSLALAVNAAAAGLAVGFAGYPIVPAAFSIGVFSIVAIALGQSSGAQVAWRVPPLVSNALGGVLLVVIGIAELRH